MDIIRQIGWGRWRFGVQYSSGPFFRRFSIIETMDGFTVNDHETQETARVVTYASAKAWAGIRVGEIVVRHSKNRVDA